MSNLDIIRAWKDEEYRNSLSEEQRSQLPENPVGMIQLSDAEMDAITGGMQKAIIAGQLLQCQTCTVNDEICCSSADPCDFGIPPTQPW